MPMTCTLTVSGSRARCLGALVAPSIMTANQTSSCSRITGGSRAVLAVKYVSIGLGRSSMSRPAASRTSRVEMMLPP